MFLSRGKGYSFCVREFFGVEFNFFGNLINIRCCWWRGIMVSGKKGENCGVICHVGKKLLRD